MQSLTSKTQVGSALHSNSKQTAASQPEAGVALQKQSCEPRGFCECRTPSSVGWKRFPSSLMVQASGEWVVMDVCLLETLPAGHTQGDRHVQPEAMVPSHSRCAKAQVPGAPGHSWVHFKPERVPPCMKATTPFLPCAPVRWPSLSRDFSAKQWPVTHSLPMCN